MKVIFLDFDGVITTYVSSWTLVPEKMDLVKKIIDATGAKIVISSAWRRKTLEDTFRFITDPNNHYVGSNPFSLCEYVVGQTDRLYSENRFSGHVRRGDEIQKWINEHDVENYIILDDEDDFLLNQYTHFVHTNLEIGITQDDVDKAIEILSNETL